MAALTEVQVGPGAGTMLRTLRQTDWLAGLAMAFLALIIVFCVFGDAVAPHDSDAQNLAERLAPGVWSSAGDWSHPLGTDSLGRDVLSRLIAGARLDVAVGLTASVLCVGLGTLIGAVSGYWNGKLVDKALMRWVDVQMGFPPGLFIIFLLLLLGSGVQTMVIALVLNNWMMTARLIRGDAEYLRSQHFVQSAKVSGASSARILRTHVAPNIRGRVVVAFMLEFPHLVLAAATINFLGLGVDSSKVSWGLMIGSSRDLLAVAWWPTVLPGLMIVLTVSSIYVISSWLEPRVDPLAATRRLPGRP
jgi:peptide/nickel transport system permease protein